MNDDILKKDLRNLQSRMTNPRADKAYAELRDRILLFMQKTKRTWAHSLLYLLDLGLKTDQANTEKLERLAKSE